MKCEQVQTLLDQYIDGELSQALAGEVGLHLSQCPACAAEMQAMVKAGAALRDALSEEPARDLFPDIAAQYRRRRGLLPGLSSVWWLSTLARWPSRLAAAGIAAVCLLFAALLVNRPQRPATAPPTEHKALQSQRIFPTTPADREPPQQERPSVLPHRQGGTANAVAPGAARLAAKPRLGTEIGKRRIVSLVRRHHGSASREVATPPRNADAPVLMVLSEPAQPSQFLSAESAEEAAPATFRLEFPGDLPDRQSVRSMSVVKKVRPDGAVESLDISFTLPDMLASGSEEREDSDEEHRRSHRGSSGSVVLVSGP